MSQYITSLKHKHLPASIVDYTKLPVQDCLASSIRDTRMVLIFKDGTVQAASVTMPKGDPENPLEEGDMRAKLRFGVKGVYNETVQQALYDKAMQLDKLKDLSQLTRILT